jgi:hypothetical protein
VTCKSGSYVVVPAAAPEWKCIDTRCASNPNWCNNECNHNPPSKVCGPSSEFDVRCVVDPRECDFQDSDGQEGTCEVNLGDSTSGAANEAECETMVRRTYPNANGVTFKQLDGSTVCNAKFGVTPGQISGSGNYRTCMLAAPIESVQYRPGPSGGNECQPDDTKLTENAECEFAFDQYRLRDITIDPLATYHGERARDNRPGGCWARVWGGDGYFNPKAGSSSGNLIPLCRMAPADLSARARATTSDADWACENQVNRVAGVEAATTETFELNSDVLDGDCVAADSPVDCKTLCGEGCTG